MPSYQWAKVEAARADYNRRKEDRRKREMTPDFKVNTFYVLWHTKKQKYLGRSGVGMRWTNTPKLYHKVGHALNAYTAAMANERQFYSWDGSEEGTIKPDPENVILIPVHLTTIGIGEEIKPLSDFYEVVEQNSKYRPYKIKRKKS